MKIAITGGHFTPALSVIEHLSIDDEVLVIGRKTAYEGETSESFEYQMCKKLSIPFEVIDTGRLQRKLTNFTFLSLLKVPKSLIRSISILKKHKPDIVLSFGGYVALPIALSAFLLGIPVVTHEQTQSAGLANKIIARIAVIIFLSFEQSSRFFPKEKIILTGNPVRKEIFNVKKSINVPKDHKIIYVTGGSGGSHFINMTIKEIIYDLLSKYVVIHQTGDSSVFLDYEELLLLKKTLPGKLFKRYVLRKYVLQDEIGWVLNNASLVISRSGINTVSELMALNIPSFLIPLPHGQFNEQLENAKLVKKVGLSDYVSQKEVTSKLLLGKIEYMIDHTKDYKSHKSELIKIMRPDSSKIIVDSIKSFYEKNKKKD